MVLTIIAGLFPSKMIDIITEGLMTGIDMIAVRNIAFTLAGFYAMSIAFTLILLQLFL